jgi:hypothetical protein
VVVLGPKFWKKLARRGEAVSQRTTGKVQEEEHTEAVEENEGAHGVLLELVVPKAHAAKSDGEHDEAHVLNRLASPLVDAGGKCGQAGQV